MAFIHPSTLCLNPFAINGKHAPMIPIAGSIYVQTAASKTNSEAELVYKIHEYITEKFVTER